MSMVFIQNVFASTKYRGLRSGSLPLPLHNTEEWVAAPPIQNTED